MLGLRVRSAWWFAAVVVGGVVVLGFAGWAALAARWWIPLVPPAMTWGASLGVVTAYMSYQEHHDRKMLMQLFSRHVSPEVAQTIWRQRADFLDGGRPRPMVMTVTIMFTDLIGFTHISEKCTPAELVVWLNEYLDAMVQQVLKHHGG